MEEDLDVKLWSLRARMYTYIHAHTHTPAHAHKHIEREFHVHPLLGIHLTASWYKYHEMDSNLPSRVYLFRP